MKIFAALVVPAQNPVPFGYNKLIRRVESSASINISGVYYKFTRRASSVFTRGNLPLSATNDRWQCTGETTTVLNNALPGQPVFDISLSPSDIPVSDSNFRILQKRRIPVVRVSRQVLSYHLSVSRWCADSNSVDAACTLVTMMQTSQRRVERRVESRIQPIEC